MIQIINPLTLYKYHQTTYFTLQTPINNDFSPHKDITFLSPLANFNDEATLCSLYSHPVQ